MQQNPQNPSYRGGQPVTPVTWEAEAGELKAHDRLQLQIKFKSNLGNLRGRGLRIKMKMGNDSVVEV